MRRLQDACEARPDPFIRYDYPKLIDDSREAMAKVRPAPDMHMILNISRHAHPHLLAPQHPLQDPCFRGQCHHSHQHCAAQPYFLTGRQYLVLLDDLRGVRKDD
jgi:hypothetical protein